jgi:hypothetical protein
MFMPGWTVQVTWKVPAAVHAGVVHTSPRSLRCPEEPPKLGAPASDLLAPRWPMARMCSAPVPLFTKVMVATRVT